MIAISESAARKIRELVTDRPGAGFRLKVVGGGCSGLQYKMGVDEPKPDDKTFEREGAQVLADRRSYLYLHGSELDFAEGLMESGFRVVNPNVKKSCGCGNSFSI
jgi:iron-sulfur cluster assembly protein